MISFVAPAWLMALGTLPLVWWLHRARGHGHPVRVSSLLPWREQSPRGAAAAAAARRPDPAWVRRALVAAAMALALAQPAIERPARSIVLWLDDSLSMSAMEAGTSRRALALAEASRLAAERGAALTVRSLTQPAHIPGSPGPAVPLPEVSPPPAGALEAEAEHWLASDGTSRTVAHWAATAPVARVIEVGTATENVAITALSARASLERPGELDVQIEIFDAGLTAAARQLLVRSGAQPLLSRAIATEAGETTLVTLRAPADSGPLHAQLEPADALSADDAMELAVPSYRRQRVALGASCPQRLGQALAAHPAISVTRDSGTGPADLTIDCGEPGALRFSARGGSRELRVPADELESQGDAGYALVLAAKLDAVLGEPLLERVARIARDRETSRLVRTIPAEPMPRTAGLASGTRLLPLAPWLAALALLLLGWDFVATARRVRQVARFEGSSG